MSKVGLMWGGELKPTNSEAAPMLREFSERVLCLFALYNGIRLAAGAGATLAQHLTERATAVLTASKVKGLSCGHAQALKTDAKQTGSKGQHVCTST